jgi:hypothetical protein
MFNKFFQKGERYDDKARQATEDNVDGVEKM